MKSSLLFCFCISVSVALVAQPAPPNSARMVESYGKLPLAFEVNQGQADSQVKFLSRGAGYSLFLTPTEAVLALQPSAVSHQPSVKGAQLPGASHHAAVDKQSSRSAVLRMKLVGANAKAEVIGQDELHGKSNYFIGNDPKKWHTNVRQFAKVRYGNVYPGVDLVYYGHQRELEYDFVLQPGANPQAIRLGIEGANRLQFEHGDLVLTSEEGDVHLRSPHIYQEANGVRHEVRGRYVIASKNEVGFRIGAYDRRRALVIDPILAYSTYLGGSGFFGQDIRGIAVDGAGNAYVMGNTASPNFPIVNALQPMMNGPSDAFVTKFNADGTGLIYSTFLGGSSYEAGAGIALDAAGNAYVCGYTDSNDFPTMNAIQPNRVGGQDAFVAKIDSNGDALVYSTFLGGSGDDEATQIAVDSVGNAYVTGLTLSTNFPTAHAIQSQMAGARDAFVTKINATGQSFVYSTYLGGSDSDEGNAITADSVGNAYVVGSTGSTDFPIANALQPNINGPSDAFVTKIKPDGSAIVYSTYLGGGVDEVGLGIAVDSSSNAYVVGATDSSDFPTVNPIQATFHGNGDTFVTKISAEGSSLVYSTYLGGSGGDSAVGVAVDSAQNLYVVGGTDSPNFPMVNPIQATNKGGQDAFVSEINAAGSALVYSTYLGGSENDDGEGLAIDSAGSVYLALFSDSKNFPITVAGFQRTWSGKITSAVAKIAPQTFVGLARQGVAFGWETPGTTSVAVNRTLTNNGTAALTIKKIYIAGANPADFSETDTCGATLASGSKCKISMTFTPTTIGKRSAALVVSDSDPASPQAIGLSGNGTLVAFSPTKLPFGDQPVGTTSASQNVTVTNTGSTQLNFSGISITGTNAGDFLQTNTCGTSIAAGASCRITVTFKPIAKGNRSADISIKDDGGGSPQKVKLTGTGT